MNWLRKSLVFCWNNNKKNNKFLYIIIIYERESLLSSVITEHN